jgi:hypothetical protein
MCIYLLGVLIYQVGARCGSQKMKKFDEGINDSEKLRVLKKNIFILIAIFFVFNLVVANELFRYLTVSSLAASPRSILFLISMDFILIIFVGPIVISDFTKIKKIRNQVSEIGS